MIMISGEILGTAHDGVLLTGTATAFGFDTAGAKPGYVDFLFDPTGGSLFLDDTFSSQFAVILTPLNEMDLPDTPDSGTIFESSFTFGAFQVVADVSPVAVPEPSTTLLMGLGLTMLTIYGRKHEGLRRTFRVSPR